ncbi:MAG: outer rane efflux protein [Gemmatimonadetes bacterium]|nr:outer rane efflux protein [Gemmatimonadota bacterium]
MDHMTSTNYRTQRVGIYLAVAAALLMGLARAASAQQGTPGDPGHLTLGEAIRLATQRSAGVQAAAARVEQARARIEQRRADLLPNLSGIAQQAGRSFNTATLGLDFPTAPGAAPFFDPRGQVIGPVNTVDFRARVAQTLFDFSALGRVRAARAVEGAAEADATAAQDLAAGQAAAAYLRALRSDAQLRARIADSTLAAELVGVAQDQLKAGVGVGLDVTRAQSQLALLRAQLIAARNDRDRASLDLRRVLSIPLTTPLALVDSLGSLQVDTPVNEQAAVDAALRQRPDLRAAEAQVNAAREQVKAIRSERLPQVGIVADEGLIGKTVSHLLPTYTWGLQLSLPVFDGFRRESRVREQQAAANEIEVRSRDLREQASVEVRSAILDLSAAREQVAAARERLTLAELEVSQARERFRAGVSGSADVITASLNLNGARTLVIDALTAYQQARVSFARATGSIAQLQ